MLFPMDLAFDIFNHLRFPVCRQAGIMPLKSKLFYDEKLVFLKEYLCSSGIQNFHYAG